ncbi:MAG: condensation domain-containing protein, partial [Burkholderiales bacterium]
METEAFLFPTSFAQQRLWFIDRLMPGTAVYNVPAVVRFRGWLDVRVLEQSLNEIVRRHEALRTTFVSVEGRPMQLITPTLRLPLPVTDLQQTLAAAHDADVMRLAVEESRRPFDLTRGPLMRASLLRVAEDEHVLLLTMHHIVSDGWSLGVLYRELEQLYRAYRAGLASRLPEPAIQYPDFAVWQRRWLEGGALDGQLAYWNKQLGGVLPALELPLDNPRPAMQDFDGASQFLTLPENLTQALKRLSRSEGVTVFTFLLAAFQLLLSRLSGQQDIIVGTPFAGRNHVETEPLIGFFIGTLALRADLSGAPSFSELLARTRKVTLDAYANQDVPFEKLVEELRPERNTARHPIFDVLINYTSSRQVTPRLDDLTIETLNIEQRQSKFLMTLYIRDEQRLGLELVYQTASFSSERATCLLEQYQYLLEQICAAPQLPISAYSLVTRRARELLPDPAAPLAEPAYPMAPDPIAAWARSRPKRTAAVQNGKDWSYTKLW